MDDLYLSSDNLFDARDDLDGHVVVSGEALAILQALARQTAADGDPDRTVN